MKILDRVKDLVACPQEPNPSYAIIFEKLAKFYLDKKDPLRTIKFEISLKTPMSGPDKKEQSSSINKTASSATTPEQEQLPTLSAPAPRANEANNSHTPQKPNSRYISVTAKKALFHRANGQCEHVDPNTKRRCQATRGLQIDHIKPHACNGSNELNNLFLLCPVHNQLRAIKYFGTQKMSTYIPTLK